MRPIPLNVMTLYADLADRVAQVDVRPGSISTKTVDGRKYLYAVEKDGQTRIQRYLGPVDDLQAQMQAAQIRQAAEQAKQRRNTVTLLKNSRVPGPTLVIGRILETVANAGLFQRGVTLVGTAAYQTYPCIVGSYLPASALMTNDIDLSVAEFVASQKEEDLQKILMRADPTFKPHWSRDDKRPKAFKASNGFSVDILTSYGRGRRSPIEIASLGCAAQALSFQEYPADESIEAVVLHGTGVNVRVPSPLRYAIHKLIVAQQRAPASIAKKRKDLAQARELIDIFIETDPDAVQDTLDDARARGRSWKTAINASLTELGRQVKQGQLPVPNQT